MLPHDELLHYGKKGMKWDKRKSDELRSEQYDRRVAVLEDRLAALKEKKGKLSPEEAKQLRSLTYRAKEARQKAATLKFRSLTPEDKAKHKSTFLSYMKNPNDSKNEQKLKTTMKSVGYDKASSIFGDKKVKLKLDIDKKSADIKSKKVNKSSEVAKKAEAINSTKKKKIKKATKLVKQNAATR